MIRDEVIAVNFYPLKGGHAATIGGEVPTSLVVGRTGFEVNGVLDRELALYDPYHQRVVTQRGYGVKETRAEHPEDSRLATLRIDILEDHMALTSVAGHLDLPLLPEEGNPRVLDIWGQRYPVIEQRGKDQDSYFKRLLGREVWLTRADRNSPRIISSRHHRDGTFNEAAGVDNLPLSLLSQASLDLSHKRNNLATGTVPISRYRGGIIIAGSGLGPFGEDYIDPRTPFSIGDIQVWAAKAIQRCTVTENDQDTGERVGQGLKVLRGRAATLYSAEGEALETGVFFGERLVHASLGTISVHDVVTVSRLSEEPNIALRAAA